jgi:hypothetical protein
VTRPRLPLDEGSGSLRESDPVWTAGPRASGRVRRARART